MKTLKLFHAYRRYRLIVIVFAFLLPLIGWEANSSTSQLKAFVSIPPLADLVEGVGGSLVAVDVLLEPGLSPVTYDPSPQLLVELTNARVLFTVGVPFEDRLLVKIRRSFDDLQIVDTREGFELKPMSHHHDDDQHPTGRFDPHIWLDPNLAKLQAATICKVLSELAPEHTITFQRNLLYLRSKLDSLDTSIRELLSPYNGMKICVFHPSFGYFCDAYGLEQMAVEVEGKEPSAKQLIELIEEMKENRISTVFVQPQFSRKSAQTIAESVGGQVVIIDPLAEDYRDNLMDIAVKIEKDLSSRRQVLDSVKPENGSN